MEYDWEDIRNRTLAVFSGPHWVHEKFASVVAADTIVAPSRTAKRQLPPYKALNLLRSSFAIPKGYEIYFTESCFYYPAIAKRLGRIDGRIINLCGSPLFYNIWKKVIVGAEARILLELFKTIDGMVLEGRYSGEVLRALGLKVPSALSYTYIKPGRYETLRKIKPNLQTKNVAITATNDIEYKGVDLLLKAMRIVNGEDPDVKLRIIHRNLDIKKIKPLMSGSVILEDDVEKALNDTSLYVHPSRGDVFPIAPLEAMLAGIPTMVSTDTGTKEFVEKVDGRYVLPLEPNEIARSIMDFFASKETEKKELSEAFRNEAEQFNETEQLQKLRSNYGELLKEL